ncbi:DUF4386 domain-containing protein [Balneolaceae bacterium YR4-1]|uniref:DUF4386 domain-containing protein n=1 Tax=Halalkalibaculum roseum TaxID=2709311 RepID=A0A6M1T3S2_9BACT|nr:DUF4386 domain-containing protein [Halalkalibaculum roseum]NGP77387.1 DUF4386 domain-containing protein [Halalkalibaculum roseum]
MADPLTHSKAVRYARVAGLLYLVIIVCAGFSEGFVRSTLVVSGDATATARNIMQSEGLFRLGLASDLIAFMCDAVVAILLYRLLKPVSKTLSLVAASLRLIAHPAIGSLNLLNHYAALKMAGGTGALSVFEPEQMDAWALLFMDFHSMGYLIAGAFFGLHCLLLGYLLYKSNLLPGFLGILLAIASVGYLTESFGMLLVPAYEDIYLLMVAISAGIAELTLCLWLLIKGVRNTENARL